MAYPSNSSKDIFVPQPMCPDCPINSLRIEHTIEDAQDAVAFSMIGEFVDESELSPSVNRNYNACYERQKSGACVVRFSFDVE